MALNRLIEIEERGVTRDSFGAEVVKWIKLATVWAEKVQVKPAERFIKTSARTVNLSMAKFKILAREDVNELMRVIDDNGVTWDIQGLIKADSKFLTLQVKREP